MSPDPSTDPLPLVPVAPLDPARVEAIRSHARSMSARAPLPPAVRLETAASAVFAVWMLVWAVSAVIVPVHG